MIVCEQAASEVTCSPLVQLSELCWRVNADHELLETADIYGPYDNDSLSFTDTRLTNTLRSTAWLFTYLIL